MNKAPRVVAVSAIVVITIVIIVVVAVVGVIRLNCKSETRVPLEHWTKILSTTFSEERVSVE